MILDELIDQLEDIAKERGDDFVPAFSFANPHSNRGYYQDLGFNAVDGRTIRQCIDDVRAAVGQTFEGYKGGHFTMYGSTQVHMSSYGNSGEPITPTHLALMRVADSWPFDFEPKKPRKPEGSVPEGHVVCSTCDGKISIGPFGMGGLCGACDYRGYVPA